MLKPPSVLLPGIIFALSGGCAFAQAPPADAGLRDQVRSCASLSDGASRLACYDEIGAGLAQADLQQGAAGASAPPEWSITLDRERVEALQRETFGLSTPSIAQMLPGFGDRRSEVASVEATIARIIDHRDGSFTFIMDNGQRWTQTEPQRASNVRVGDTITIRRGLLGSFVLSPQRGGAPHRVRREN